MDVSNSVTACHLSKDPIGRLRIEVMMWAVDTEEAERRSFNAVFRWQEKVFGPAEVLMYRKLERPVTPLERKYKDEVSRLDAEAGREVLGNTLFTYVDSDGFVDPAEYERGVTTSGRERLSKLARGVLEQHANVNTRAQGVFGLLPIPGAAAAAARSRKQKAASGGGAKALASHFSDTRFQVMHIMAACGPDRMFQQTLCQIRAYSNGVLEIRPDFTDDVSTPYRFRAVDNTVWEYTVSNLSEEPEFAKRTGAGRSASARAAAMRRNLIGKTFLPSPPVDDSVYLSVVGEIVAATDFVDASRIYIRYFLDVPLHWSLVPEPGSDEAHANAAGVHRTDAGISETTHAAGVRLVRRTDLPHLHRSEAYFAQPIAWHLSGRPDGPWPRLFFEVISPGAWQSQRALGYGYVDLPRSAGSHTLRVGMWRPCLSVRDRLREAFLGVTPALDDVRYSSIPTGFSRNVLNRFGFNTESTGTVTVRMHVVLQDRRIELPRLPVSRNHLAPLGLRRLASRPAGLAASRRSLAPSAVLSTIASRRDEE